MADLEGSLDRVGRGRSFAGGKATFNDAQCILCHRFGNEGGSVGPELTAVSSKYKQREILESLIEPSKVVSEQYQNFTILKKNGESETGRIVDETDERITLQSSPLLPDRLELQKSEIADRRPSKVSPMPEALLSSFTEDEILDLLAHLESGGKDKTASR